MLKQGDVILVKGNGLISWAIKKFTNSPYSHAACFYGDGHFIESDWGGVKLAYMSKYENTDYDIYRCTEANKQQLWLASEWMLSQAGSKYDYLGILGIAKQILFNQETNIWDNKDRYWCSELVADGYIKAGIPLEAEKDTRRISPGDLARSQIMVQINEPATM